MTRPEFVQIAAGAFVMGAEDAPHPEDGEGPRRSVALGAYRIAACAVSNADFAGFVAATGYVTTAEERGNSHVFFAQLTEPDLHPTPLAEAPWWRAVQGAQWRRPNGSTDARPKDPVVHVSFRDALAYSAWRQARLPTEAEWERAAQGSARQPLNIWSGGFPDAPEGVPGVRPVSDGPPNPQGLIHACGNVWEWTADGFGRLHSPRPVRNPTGNLRAHARVVKGGSYLCAPSYCARFRPSARRPEDPQATTGHMGFRIATDPV